MTLWGKLVDKMTTFSDAVRQLLEDAGFRASDSIFARRVREGVLALAEVFQRENYSILMGRLVAAIFSRMARGMPPTPEFLAGVWREIEKAAADFPYDEQDEKGRWVHKRYPMMHWAGDLHDHVKGMVFPREKTSRETFAGAPLHREGPPPETQRLVEDKAPKVVREVRVSELRKLAMEGRKIQAIKLYRDCTGKGLRESKDFVEALCDGKSVLVDDTLQTRDSYDWPSEPVRFAMLDHYGSMSAFAPGKAQGELSVNRVEVDRNSLGNLLGILLGSGCPTEKKQPDNETAKMSDDSAGLRTAMEDTKETEKAEEKMDAKGKTIEIIRDFCRNMESFTSLDVSNRAKVDGVVARHREIAELVRTAFADGELSTYGYVRDLISVTVPGGSAQAYLYHHMTVPSDDYRSRAQIALKPVRQPQPVPVPHTDDDDDDSPALPAPTAPQPAAQAAVLRVGRLTRVLNTSSVTRTQKGDGRLEVPHVWLARLGWQEGDTVSAVRDGNALVLKTLVQPGETVVRQFTVDRWRRIRITTKALNEAGIHFGTGGQHIVTLRADDIRID